MCKKWMKTRQGRKDPIHVAIALLSHFFVLIMCAIDVGFFVVYAGNCMVGKLG